MAYHSIVAHPFAAHAHRGGGNADPSPDWRHWPTRLPEKLLYRTPSIGACLGVGTKRRKGLTRTERAGEDGVAVEAGGGQPGGCHPAAAVRYIL